MTRGMITIATGKKHYYKLAANLLLSYRKFSKNPLPFAIIAEEENEYTKLFDDVILTTEAKRSFVDKFLLLKLCPYDENIFFDADSLAYGDLNEYWDFFSNATDFSALGENFPLDHDGGAWYDADGIGEYAKLITYKTRVHMGVCFVRNSEKTKKMYADCMELLQNYDKLHFHTCPLSVDECVIGLAMPMNQFRAIPEKAHMMAAYPCLTMLNADMLRNRLKYKTAWGTSVENGILLHWGTKQTFDPLYRFNVECLEYRIRREDVAGTLVERIKYDLKFRYCWLMLLHTPKLLKAGSFELLYAVRRIVLRVMRKFQK